MGVGVCVRTLFGRGGGGGHPPSPRLPAVLIHPRRALIAKHSIPEADTPTSVKA